MDGTKLFESLQNILIIVRKRQLPYFHIFSEKIHAKIIMTRIKEIEIAFINAYEEDIRLEAEKHLQSLSPSLLYHCASHTFDHAYPEAKRLAKMEMLDDDEILIIVLIALYHDTGFTDQYVANEELGAQKARDYATDSNNQVLQNAAQLIFETVLNTNMKSAPKNKYEEIIRDADLSILGKPEFLEWNQRLRLEILSYPESSMYQLALDEANWIRSQLDFLKNHQWFSESARMLYEEQKTRNIQQLNNLLDA